MSAAEQMLPQFSKARLDKIETLVKRYPHPKSALLPVLHLAQEDFGHLSMPVQQMVADTLGLRLMAVREVVTFYTMFREQPCGTHLIEVCTNAGCMLNGAYDLLSHLEKTLGLKAGGTTPDGMFTVAEVECAGACGGAPVVQVNNIYHENVDAAHLDDMIAKAKAGKEEGK
jgi:NADH-quinone oxidoreductase subunit E